MCNEMEEQAIYKTAMHPYSAVGLKDINDIVCEVFKIERAELLTRTRKRNIVDARGVAMWWTRKQQKTPFAQIASNYKLDHATTLHHVRKIDQLIEVDKEMQQKVSKVVELASPFYPIIKIDDQIVLKRREYKRVLLREYLRGANDSAWLKRDWDQLPAIGRYRSIKRFLEGLN
jgi:hypothetical protein